MGSSNHIVIRPDELFVLSRQIDADAAGEWGAARRFDEASAVARLLLAVDRDGDGGGGTGGKSLAVFDARVAGGVDVAVAAATARMGLGPLSGSELTELIDRLVAVFEPGATGPGAVTAQAWAWLPFTNARVMGDSGGRGTAAATGFSRASGCPTSLAAPVRPRPGWRWWPNWGGPGSTTAVVVAAASRWLINWSAWRWPVMDRVRRICGSMIGWPTRWPIQRPGWDVRSSLGSARPARRRFRVWWRRPRSTAPAGSFHPMRRSSTCSAATASPWPRSGERDLTFTVEELFARPAAHSPASYFVGTGSIRQEFVVEAATAVLADHDPNPWEPADPRTVVLTEINGHGTSGRNALLDALEQHLGPDYLDKLLWPPVAIRTHVADPADRSRSRRGVRSTGGLVVGRRVPTAHRRRDGAGVPRRVRWRSVALYGRRGPADTEMAYESGGLHTVTDERLELGGELVGTIRRRSSTPASPRPSTPTGSSTTRNSTAPQWAQRSVVSSSWTPGRCSASAAGS